MRLEPDLQQAHTFLSLLGAESNVTIQTFADRPINDSQLTRVLNGNFQAHVDLLCRLNAKGAGVFVMVNRGDGLGRKAKNVLEIRALFIDMDGSPLENLLSADAKPQIVVQSSPGRFHAYWLVTDCTLEQFTPLQVALAARFDGDVSVKDLPRVMRLPGFWHQKNKPFQTRILQETTALPYATDDLIEQLGLSQLITAPFAEKRPMNASFSEYKIPINGFDQGGRDNGLFRYACRLRQRGLRKEEASLLMRAAAANCRPPMSEIEAEKCLESAWRYPDETPESLTDVGNAQRLVRIHGEDLHYMPELKKWLVWEGTYWRIDQDGAISRRAKDTAASIYNEAKFASENGNQEIAKKLASHATQSQSATRIRAMIELAQSEAGVPLRTNELDKDNFLLNVSNGVVDLRTGLLREPRRRDLITKRSPFVYAAQAEAPLFLSFLKRIFNGNQRLIDFLQRAIGYSLTGDTSEQCLFFLHGSGANGKSTLLNVIKTILGEYSMQCSGETLMIKKSGSNVSNDIARLRGSRFVATSEIEDGQRLAESMLKQVTGQDTITARFLFAEHFEFTPRFKIWLAANHKPIIRGDDYAIWRRIHLLPFTVTIPIADRDKNLADKLSNESTGILSWAVQGCLEWQRQGLQPPEEVLVATGQYKSEMDLVGSWIEECCIVTNNATGQASVLYQNYKRWVENNGGVALSSTKFGVKLSDRGFSKEKKGTILYHGIGLLKTDGLEGAEGCLQSYPKHTHVEVFQEKLSKPSQSSRDEYLAASKGC